MDLDGYVFDPKFHELSGDGDEKHVALFRLLSDSEPDLYVRLVNEHNGYYDHGFTFKGEITVDDCI